MNTKNDLREIVGNIIANAEEAHEWERKNFTEDDFKLSAKWKTHVEVKPINPIDYELIPDVDTIPQRSS